MILGNIFEIANVSSSELLVKNNKFIFRLFDGFVFYQYIFILGKGEDIKYVSNRIERYVIYLDNDINKKKHDKIIYQLIWCQNELEVYKLLSRVL